MKYWAAGTLVVVVMLIGLPVLAATLPTVRLEVVPVDPTAELHETFWSRIRRYLGSRATPVIRPEPGTEFIVQASAYASSPYQTDSSPCITAAGTRVRPGVAAANFLPLGTEFVDEAGNKYRIEDRMNARYGGRYIDLWFRHTSDALVFGRQRGFKIRITGYGTPGAALDHAAAPVAEADAEEPSAYRRANLRFIAAMRLFSTFLNTRVSRDVNRYDVDCSVQ